LRRSWHRLPTDRFGAVNVQWVVAPALFFGAKLHRRLSRDAPTELLEAGVEGIESLGWRDAIE
jgi:hypothetical protein